MNLRIKNCEDMQAGKEGKTAGGFLYFVLILFAGMSIGWLRPMIFEVQPTFLGLPLFYYGLLTIFAKELIDGLGTKPFKNEIGASSNNETITTGGWVIVVIFIALILLGLGWTLYQVSSVLGTIGWSYLIYKTVSQILSWTLYRKSEELRNYANIFSSIFTGYIIYLILF